LNAKTLATAILSRERPAHIAPERVVDYDVYRGAFPDTSRDLHEGLFRLGEESGRGIFWTPHNGGHWFINDYELLFSAARQPELFSSTEMTIPPVPVEPKLIPLFLDPPQHALFRVPLMRQFTPGKVAAMETGIRAFTNELIDAIEDGGHCDFVEAIAEPLPIKIFMRIMGMPLDRMREFRNWILDMLSPDDDRRASSYANIAGLMDGLIRERQATPQDDLISHLLTFEIDNRQITYDEIQAYCLLLFAAGLDTVANALAFGMNFLAGRADLQARLAAEPALIPRAAEELLRKFGVPMPARTATSNFSFGGAQIRKGERVMLMLPGANLDPAAFPDPNTFDLDRDDAHAHIAFNVGPHRCIGSHLARLELRVFWEEWLRRIPTFRHDSDRPAVFRAGLTLAVQDLGIRWD
jgi:cytochrome P450